MTDDPDEILRDVRTIGRIETIPMLLRIVSDTTGMGFAAVARVTGGTWTACAVHDKINFNLLPGAQLDLGSTLCKEVREATTPIVIDHASLDPVYCTHHTPRTYAIESYISVPIVLSDGQYFGNLCAIDPQPANLRQSGVVTMFVSFAQLIALQLEAERKREVEHEAMLDERAVGELREQFIAVLSHDLRNPLAAVLACGKLLHRKRDDPAAVLEIAERIDKSAWRMSALIDDTLDLARARLGGGIGLALQDIENLAPVLGSVVSELQTVWPQRAIDSHIDVPCSVRCDPGRVQQLASNLLGNALVHGSPAGPVALSATADGDFLVLSVTNQGEAITPENMMQVFKPFWRQAASPAREGLGLGLYICAQIAKAHGGSLEVASTAETGTAFTARLPLRGHPR